MTRRGRGLPEESYQPRPLRVIAERAAVINESGDLNTDGPRRWRVSVSATVFQGFAFLTDEDAYKLQDQLKERKDVFGNVFLQAQDNQQPNDYTTVESVIADIELATPRKS